MWATVTRGVSGPLVGRAPSVHNRRMSRRRAHLWIGGLFLVVAVWLAVWLPAREEGPKSPPGPPPRSGWAQAAADVVPAPPPTPEPPAPAPDPLAPSDAAAAPARVEPAPRVVPRPAPPMNGSPAAAPPVVAPEAPSPVAPAAPTEEDEPDPATALVWSPDKEGIQGAVREVIPEIKECYEGWLEADRTLGGTLRVRFSIEVPEGGTEAQVTNAALLSSDMDHPFMEGCVLNAMSQLRFDPPQNGKLDVTYPLKFQAKDDGDPAE